MEGRLVRLAPLRDEDAEPMFEWINDRELVILNAPFKPVSLDEHESWFERIRQTPDVEIFGIRRREDDDPPVTVSVLQQPPVDRLGPGFELTGSEQRERGHVVNVGADDLLDGRVAGHTDFEQRVRPVAPRALALSYVIFVVWIDVIDRTHAQSHAGGLSGTQRHSRSEACRRCDPVGSSPLELRRVLERLMSILESRAPAVGGKAHRGLLLPRARQRLLHVREIRSHDPREFER